MVIVDKIYIALMNVSLLQLAFRLSVLVKGFIAEVTSDLHYKNDDTKSVEASFTFPLDDDRYDCPYQVILIVIFD